MVTPINLAELGRQRGIRRKRVVLRRVSPSRTQEMDLYAVYAEGVAAWQRLAATLAEVYTEPAPVTADATPASMQHLVDQTAREADGILFHQTEGLGRWVRSMGTWHGQRTISAAKSALGVDIEPFVRLSDVQDILTESIERNTTLIRDLNGRTKSRVEAILYDAQVNRRTKREVVAALSEAMGITKRRARLIASDQAHKLNIALTAFRNEQLGIKSYIWDTRKDDRVRPGHRVREGKLFQWAHPPWDGHPGFAVACRCAARSVVELG